MTDKCVQDVMVPLDDVYALDVDEELNNGLVFHSLARACTR